MCAAWPICPAALALSLSALPKLIICATGSAACELPDFDVPMFAQLSSSPDQTTESCQLITSHPFPPGPNPTKVQPTNLTSYCQLSISLAAQRPLIQSTSAHICPSHTPSLILAGGTFVLSVSQPASSLLSSPRESAYLLVDSGRICPHPKGPSLSSRRLLWAP